MKQITIITILIFCLCLALPFGVQANEPFSRTQGPFQQQTQYTSSGTPYTPFNNNTKGGPFGNNGNSGPFRSGPMDDLPNDDEGGGGWVGSTTIGDNYLLLLALAVGYGIYRRSEKKLFKFVKEEKYKLINL
jgi:hypothetical protein